MIARLRVPVSVGLCLILALSALPILGTSPPGTSAISASATPAKTASPVTPIPGSAIARAVAATDPDLAALAAKAPASVWSNAWAQVVAAHQRANGVHVDGGNSGTLIVGGAAVVAATVCFVAGVETVGLACLAAVVAVGVIALYEFFFGSDAASQLAASAANLGKRMVLDGAYEFNLQANATVNVLNALNLTANALGYEAAAGALSQLPNSSFNGPLDLVQSGIADQLASEMWANGESAASIYGNLVNGFDVEEGSSDSSGFTCPLSDNGGFLNSGTVSGFQAPGTGTPICPQSSPASFTFPYGAEYPTAEGYAMGAVTSGNCGGPPVYLNPGMPMFVAKTGGSPTNLTAIFQPVSGSNHWFNVTAGAVHEIVNFTFAGKEQGYRVCDATSGAVLYPEWSFPLNGIAEGGVDTAPFNLIFVSSGGSSNEFGNGTAIISQGCPQKETSGGSFDVGANEFGGPPTCAHGVPGDQTFGRWLWAIASSAEVVGQTYWTFLRALGYTSISQVPANCIIPTPSQLLPPTIPVSDLSSLNVSTLLTVYYATLFGLGKTFNATNALTVSNFCGKHVTWNQGNSTLGFGTYAYGFVYVPGAANASDGHTAQVFGTPSTWNLSGRIYIAPAVASMLVSLNQTWVLGEHNPAILFVVPFTNGTAGRSGVQVNIHGPTQCLSATQKTGCNTTAGSMLVTGFVAGNSTNKNGSAFPTSVDSGAGAGVAVFLTFCAVAQAGSASLSPTFVSSPGVCLFGHSTLNATATQWGCGAVIGANCNSGVGPILAGGNACGQSFPIWAQLVTTFASFTGTSTLGCLVAEIIAGVVLVGLIGLFVFLAVRIGGAATSRPPRMRSS